jgi:diacylglycerol kinase (ATP)
MQPGRPLKFLFVINPVSGGKSKNNWNEAITDYFRSRPHPIEIYLLTGKNDADQLTNKIKQLKPDRVVAVGGDGTVNMVARTLLGTGIPMAILPAGSANGLAKELRLPDDPKLALEIAEYGSVRDMDVLKINKDIISLHLADIGLNAQLVKYFEEDNWRGKLGYAKVLLKTLWRKQQIKVTIETDKNTLMRRAYMVVIANSKTYGTGAVINPIGKLDDGKFEIVIVRKLALSELLKMIFNHQPYNPRKVEILRCTRVVLNSKHRSYFQSDGEYIGRENHIQAEILHDQLSIIQPDDNFME